MSLTVKSLVKRFGQQTAVNHISFQIEKGIVGFLGPNGAGKSTTMKMITGYLQPDEGAIFISGVQMTPDNIIAKKKIGYLPESNPLYPEMYVREYLQFIAGLHGLKHSGALIEEKIEQLGLTQESHKHIHQLSKGYKQRVGLAAALLHDPEILILDEPTSGLDPNQIIEIRSVIQSLAATKTILFSTHIMQEVEALCERAIIINKGNIVADESLVDLRSRVKGKETLIVSFAETLTQELLSSLPDMLTFTQVNGMINTWKIESDTPTEARKQIVQWSLEKEMNIVSLQNEKKDLESIFQSLTLNISSE